jgi:alkanesulfonate monooxygenase SsuD/methylene tetrahydromethanopterin reductase-like flavin-dependent oxidoreductase (luciferase family)
VTSFGLVLPTFASPGPALFRTPSLPVVDPQLCLNLAREADAEGFDSLWAPDHLMVGVDDDVLEGWTVLSAVAAVTHRARLGLIQQSNLFRAPGPSARALTTLDGISGGRSTLFVGLGTKPENDAYGLAAGAPGEDERAERLIEALEVMRKIWSGARVDHEGQHYHLSGAHGPATSAPPLWFSSLRSDVLAALAPTAAGWSSSPVTPAEAARRYALVAAALERAGRPRDAIEYGLETQVLVADDLDEVRARLREMIALGSHWSGRPALCPSVVEAFANGSIAEVPKVLSDRWLIGTPEMVGARIGEYLAAGTTHFLLWFMDVPSREGIRCFNERVRPSIDAIRGAGRHG